MSVARVTIVYYVSEKQFNARNIKEILKFRNNLYTNSLEYINKYSVFNYKKRLIETILD